MEYAAELFMVDYGTHSIGWEREEDRPYKQAERWMNKLAREGWVLDRWAPGNAPTELYVVMSRRYPHPEAHGVSPLPRAGH